MPAELRKGEVDGICAAVDAEQEAGGAVPFILDLSKVSFMGSHAMGVLLGLNSELKARGRRLIFAGLQPYVLQAITVSRVNKVMEIAADVEAAKKTVTS